MNPKQCLLALAALMTLASAPIAQGQSLCPGDATNDGQVNGVDLAEVLAGWGPCRPVILEITPNSGFVAGGTLVTISGAYFNSASSVEFGGVTGTGLTVLNPSTLRVVTPPGAVGSAAVRVTTSAGNAVSKGGFTYVWAQVPSWATLIEVLPDPAVVTDDTLRAAIIATGYAWRVRHTQTQIEMLLVPPGTFNMGCSASSQGGCSTSESPVHEVTLTSPFYLGRYEVTQAQWTTVMGSNPSHFQSASPLVPASQVPNRPVEMVSWNMVQSFNAATGLRLPTEAEWEYAYRAGSATAFHSFTGYPNGTNDDTLLGNIAWFGGNNGQGGTPADSTKIVGQKAGNALGLHDVAGNVHEWVNDFFGNYQAGPAVDPQGPSTGDGRVWRGGSYASSSGTCRSSHKYGDPPGNRHQILGFRVARNP
jgi:formylglycine-generating enzyme required for sulfatase activity